METANIDFIVKELLKYIGMREYEFFFNGSEFKQLIMNADNANTKEELKAIFSQMVSSIKSNTGLKFDYELPMIWDNWGLNYERYCGSGGGCGTEYGYGSDTQLEIGATADINFILRQVAGFVFHFKSQDKDITKRKGIWKEVLEKRKLRKITLDILGEIWLENMGPEDLQKLQIRSKSFDPCDYREIDQRISIPSNSKVINLIMYAIELVARHNINMDQELSKINLSDNEEYSELRLRIPLTGSLYSILPLNIKELVAISEQQQLSDLNQAQREGKSTVDKDQVTKGQLTQRFLQGRDSADIRKRPIVGELVHVF
jgi:hypothetical protein